MLFGSVFPTVSHASKWFGTTVTYGCSTIATAAPPLLIQGTLDYGFNRPTEEAPPPPRRETQMLFAGVLRVSGTTSETDARRGGGPILKKIPQPRAHEPAHHDTPRTGGNNSTEENIHASLLLGHLDIPALLRTASALHPTGLEIILLFIS